ncbi:MAG: glucuronyl hydrolase [Planctomycetes bacterium]|nr:glucuronyl hydrolase [Planctomycetota bacterium]
MTQWKTLALCILTLACGCTLQERQNRAAIDDTMALAEIQAENMIKTLTNPRTPVPRSVQDSGQLKAVKTADWTSGFFPGSLWYLYEATGKAQWLEQATSFTSLLESQQHNRGTHDVGFIMYCSYGNGYRLTENPAYKDILLQSARSLITRFSRTTGCIRSWDFNKDRWQFPVIIDNMMNLELLFWAAKASGDKQFYDIAVSHADTTLKNHFREDGSCWHVVDYDRETGDVRLRQTHQGFSDDSSWSRGQSWGIYGFTLCYRETGDVRYLKQARKAADYVLNHPNLPEDSVPYWDLLAPNIPNEPRDASSAAILCSALYELSIHLGTQGTPYRKAADRILYSLCSEAYVAEPGENHNFLLKHSVGSQPKNSEVNVPLVYADYYLLEAFLRQQTLD